MQITDYISSTWKHTPRKYIHNALEVHKSLKNNPQVGVDHLYYYAMLMIFNLATLLSNTDDCRYILAQQRSHCKYCYKPISF